MRLAIFVEGGGAGRSNARDKCRIGFGRLIEAALGRGMPRPLVIPCGTRAEAFRDFEQALRLGTYDHAILLVDAEEPVAGAGKWDHVRRRPDDGWKAPAGVDEEHLHFMAQSMETWLAADPETLAAYYGKNFRNQDLPHSVPDLETVPKQRIFAALKKATQNTQAGAYHKTRHAFDLIGRVRPDRVAGRCPTYGAAFFDAVRHILGNRGTGFSAGRKRP